MRKFLLLPAFLLLLPRLWSQGCSVICNGSFDNTSITTGVALVTTIPCWSTTASDGQMEVWGTGFNSVPSFNGPQHVELNATQGATMFQDFPVTSGTTYTVCFAHRGRAGTDTMAVSVGPAPSGPFTSLGKFGDGTTAWGYYCVTFTPTVSTTFRLRFTPVYWSGGNNAIGNFLDAVSVVGVPAVSVTIASPTICLGQSTTLVAAGASTYTWSINSTAPAILVSPLVTTVYTLTAASGTCISVSTHTVFVQSATVSATGNTICAGSPGVLTASGSQSYTWSPGNLTGPSVTVMPQSTTVYTVATNSAGCIATASATMVVKNAPAASFTIVPVTCSSPGQVTAQGLGGTGPFTFMWMPGAIAGPVAANLSQGTYTVTILDSGTGCSSTSLALVGGATIPLSALGSTVCAGQTVSLAAFSSPGVTYTWTGPSGFFSTQQNPQIPNAVSAASGSYTVWASQGPVCTKSAVVDVQVNNPVVFTATTDNSSFCAQGHSGSRNSITLTPAGAANYTLVTPQGVTHSPFAGSPPFVISALPPYPPVVTPVTATLYGIAPGYCTSSVAISFTIIPNPVVSVTSSTPVICAGETFTYHATGAQAYTWTAAAPNTFFVSGNSTGISNPGTSSPFAVYGSSLGCNSAPASGSISVVPAPLVAAVPGSVTVCRGSGVKLRAEGTADTYFWSPFTGLNATSGKEVTATPAVNITYTVTGYQFHCASSAVVTLSVAGLPEPSAVFSDRRVCVNEYVTLTGSGGSVYHWSGPAGLILHGKTVEFPVLGGHYAGTYTLSATDANGCTGYTTANLQVDPLPTGNLAGLPGGCAPFCASYSFNGDGSVTGSWTVQNKKYAANSFTHCFSAPGTYTIEGRLTNTVTGCRNTAGYTVQAFPKPVADFRWDPEVLTDGVEEVRLINSSTGSDQSEWSLFFDDDKKFRPVGREVTYHYNEPGRYTVAMVVKNVWGCADTVVKIIEVLPDVSLYVPDVFTPNADGRNDTFMAVGRGLKEYSLAVYDRWGERIFYSEEIAAGWDGTFRGEQCQQDVYNWQITVTTFEGETIQKLGRVTLLR